MKEREDMWGLYNAEYPSMKPGYIPVYVVEEQRVVQVKDEDNDAKVYGSSVVIMNKYQDSYHISAFRHFKFYGFEDTYKDELFAMFPECNRYCGYNASKHQFLYSQFPADLQLFLPPMKEDCGYPIATQVQREVNTGLIIIDPCVTQQSSTLGMCLHFEYIAKGDVQAFDIPIEMVIKDKTLCGVYLSAIMNLTSESRWMVDSLSSLGNVDFLQKYREKLSKYSSVNATRMNLQYALRAWCNLFGKSDILRTYALTGELTCSTQEFVNSLHVSERSALSIKEIRSNGWASIEDFEVPICLNVDEFDVFRGFWYMADQPTLNALVYHHHLYTEKLSVPAFGNVKVTVPYRAQHMASEIPWLSEIDEAIENRSVEKLCEILAKYPEALQHKEWFIGLMQDMVSIAAVSMTEESTRISQEDFNQLMDFVTVE